MKISILVHMGIKFSLDVEAGDKAQAETLARLKIPELLPPKKGFSLESLSLDVYMQDKYLTSGIYTVAVEGELYYTTKVAFPLADSIEEALMSLDTAAMKQVHDALPQEVSIRYNELLLGYRCKEKKHQRGRL